MPTPAARLSRANDAPLRPDRDYVLYWMISTRRTRWSFALDHAIARARALQRPLLVLEALRYDYPWANARHHQFVLDGMAANAERLSAAGVTVLSYVEPAPRAAEGLVACLAGRAVCVVTDEFPCFFLPRMVTALAARLDVALEVVDSNGLMPLRATPGPFPTAYAFRRFLHKHLAEHLYDTPDPDPLAADLSGLTGANPPAETTRWLDESPGLALPAGLDRSVAPSSTVGGEPAARRALERFVSEALPTYLEQRNDPHLEGTSGLSPYLHFGHVSVHEVFDAVTRRAPVVPRGEALGMAAGPPWHPGCLQRDGKGQREGFWQLPPTHEAFLDQLVTWRELGYAFSFHRPDYDQYSSLPSWALATLEAHKSDRRPSLYDLSQLEDADTHDAVWNAAQRQLVRTGRIHNTLRMLWGKKVLEWSPTPEEAVRRLVHLNNRYALDGRDPNSYSGIFWIFGRFDRPWGPVRPIFGTVRYMSSENARRKLHLGPYLAAYGGDPA